MKKRIAALGLCLVALATFAAETPLFVHVDNLLFGNPETQNDAWEKLKGGDRAQIIPLIVERLRTERRGRRNGDPTTERQASGVKALGRFGKEGLAALVEMMKKDFYVSKSDHPSLVEAFRSSGEVSLDALFELLAEPNAETKEAAAHVLGQITELSLARLKAGMKSQDPWMRSGVARAIAKSNLADDVKVPLLIELVLASDSASSWASAGLSQIGEKAVAPIETTLAAKPDERNKMLGRVLIEIARNAEVARLDAEAASGNPSAPELKTFVGSYRASVKGEKNLGTLKFHWQGERLVGTLRGQENFGEHGSAFFEVPVDETKWTEGQRLSFVVGKRDYYRSYASIGKTKNIGGGNLQLRFACSLEKKTLVCSCDERPRGDCLYDKVPFQKLP